MNAAAPASSRDFSASPTSSKKMILSPTPDSAARARNSRESGPLPAITSSTSARARETANPSIRSSTPLARLSLDKNSA